MNTKKRYMAFVIIGLSNMGELCKQVDDFHNCQLTTFTDQDLWGNERKLLFS